MSEEEVVEQKGGDDDVETEGLVDENAADVHERDGSHAAAEEGPVISEPGHDGKPSGHDDREENATERDANTSNLESAKAAGVAAAAERAMAANARAQDRGNKRSRDDVETAPSARIYAPPTLYSQAQPTAPASAAAPTPVPPAPIPPVSAPAQPAFEEPSKRPRQNCYKCGGTGHIAVMCSSRQGAIDGPGAIECRTCTGRGHMARECPSSLSRDQCFRCGQLGHRGRECPTTSYNDGQFFGNPAPAAHVGMHPHPLPFAQPHYPPAPDLYGQQYGAMFQMSGFPPGQPGGYPMPAPVGGRGNFYKPPPGSGKCFRCGEEGHWTRDCPMKPADADPNGCYKCGRTGHRARDCNVCYRCMQPGHLAAQCPTSAR